MRYATLDEFKAYLKVDVDNDTEDSLLGTFLDESSAILDEFIGHASGATATTVRRFDAITDVEDGRILTFDGAYCVGITSVVNGNGVTIPTSDYVTEPRNVRPHYGITLKTDAAEVWTFNGSPEDAISITAYWCYTTNADGSADALIVGATLQLAAWLYRSKDNVAELSRPIQTGDGVTILPLALPRAVLDRIEARRRRV